MASSINKTTMLLRVIITPECIKQLTLPKVPSSVDELKEILCDKLKIDQNFVIQYEDPDFGGQLCNLSNIEELPSDKVTLKIIWEMFKTASEFISSSLSSASSSTVREERWPRVFLIPNFSYDVEFRLRKANEVYEKQKTMDVTRDVKTEILKMLAETVYSFKAYPSDSEIEQVAVALVSRHPCLRELGCDTGSKGWKMSLKFKMGNYRQKLRNAGCSELDNNRDDGSRVPQKKPRRSEINFLPDNPVGLEDAALEHEREQLELEVKKRNMDMTILNTKMETTFPLRRKEIVNEQPLVSGIKERWPGLFLEDQVSYILGVKLGKRTRGVKLAILEVMEDDLSQATKRCLNFSIILEETVVMEDLSDFPTAFMVLFELLYALNIEYSKGLKYTFEAVQNIFVGLGEKCTNRVQSLNNKLFTV
uniref:PB1 domain-containing protein n=1 Tax=Sinocyclocheilus rhinocerous TaxID=307959 RepID=A0A673JYL1_9TELE